MMELFSLEMLLVGVGASLASFGVGHLLDRLSDRRMRRLYGS
jgi:hypothetical protein